MRPSLFPYGLIRDAVNGRINKSRCYVESDVYKKAPQRPQPEGGADPGRFAGGSRVAALFLLLRSDVLPLWVCGVLLAASILLGICDVYADYRRKRPRQRWRDAWLMLLCLSLVMGVIMPSVVFAEAPDDRATACMLLGLGAVSFAACLYSLWRWRRLRSDAELRLWQLRMKRRKLTASRRMQANM